MLNEKNVKKFDVLDCKEKILSIRPTLPFD
jgi:hypothetical protein